MIGRVGAVLAQIIKPIASSTGKTAIDSFQRYKPPAQEQPPQEEAQPEAEVEQRSAAAPTAQVISFPKGALPSETVRPSVPHAFILLIDALRQTRHRLRKLIGLHAYRAMAQKTGKRYRKGAMLDRQAR